MKGLKMNSVAEVTKTLQRLSEGFGYTRTVVENTIYAIKELTGKDLKIVDCKIKYNNDNNTVKVKVKTSIQYEGEPTKFKFSHKHKIRFGIFDVTVSVYGTDDELEKIRDRKELDKLILELIEKQ